MVNEAVIQGGLPCIAARTGAAATIVNALMYGIKGVRECGYRKNNVLAGFPHLHFASCPDLMERLFR